jgi:uncharacterized membrane protein YqjE
MDQASETEGGLFTSLRRILDSGLALVQNRFQLFTVELQEEKIRCIDLLLRVAAVVVLSFMALIAVTAMVVVWLWDTSPVAVLAIVTLVYGLAAAGVGYSLQQRLQRDPPPFAGTLAEFKKDGECLGKRD